MGIVVRDPSRAHLGCAPTGPRAGALRCWISMRACGASVSARQRLRFRTLHKHRHNHLLRELREHPIQTMSLLRAAPLPTPLKIYGLSLFPAELIPLTSYAGIAITFNLLRAQHVQDVATEPGHPVARGCASFGLAHGTACRHGGPQALKAPKQSRAPLGPRIAARWPLRAATEDTGAGATAVELLQPSGRGSLCAGGLSCGRSPARLPAAWRTRRTPRRP